MADNPWESGGKYASEYGSGTYGGDFGSPSTNYGTNFGNYGQFSNKYYNKWKTGGDLASKFIPDFSSIIPLTPLAPVRNRIPSPYDVWFRGYNFKKSAFSTTSDSTAKTCTITCTVYITSDSGFLTDAHDTFAQAFLTNVMAVWNGQTFAKNGDTYTMVLAPPNFQVILVGNWIGTAPTPITPFLTSLRTVDEDSFLFVAQTQAQRSAVFTNKAGILDMTDTTVTTAPHEMGHVFGLADRYHYFHLTSQPAQRTRTYNNLGSLYTQNAIVNITPTMADRFNNTPAAGDGIDYDGNTTYNVQSNFGQQVQPGVSIPMAEPFYLGNDIAYGTAGAKGNWTNNLMAGGLSLTDYQLNRVCGEDPESDYPQYSFIKNTKFGNNDTDTATPSFVGLYKNGVIHDDTPSSATPISDIADAVSRDQIYKHYGYINPFAGLTLLDEFRFIDPVTFQPDAEDLEELAYNGIIRRLIIERVRDQREVDDAIRAVITKKQNEYNKAPGNRANIAKYNGAYFPANQPSRYDESGVADDYGRRLWNTALVNNYKHWMQFTSTRAGRNRGTDNFFVYQIGKEPNNNAAAQHEDSIFEFINRINIVRPYLLAN